MGIVSQNNTMIEEVKGVFKWYFNFTQLGAISNAREEDRKSFRILWFIAYALGWVFTFYLVKELVYSIYQYEVDTKIRDDQLSAMPFPSITGKTENPLNTDNAPSSGKFGRQGFFHYWELFHYWERSELDT